VSLQPHIDDDVAVMLVVVRGVERQHGAASGLPATATARAAEVDQRGDGASGDSSFAVLRPETTRVKWSVVVGRGGRWSLGFGPFESWEILGYRGSQR
jgi:hypothetical protein